MDIFTFFSSVSLTHAQRQALEQIELFLQDKTTSIFLLKGYAGTGKTFLMKGIVAYLRATHRATAAMAPTGRAARVITHNTGVKATTIHKAIYNYGKLEQYEVSEEKTPYSFKFFFVLNQNRDPLSQPDADPKDAVYLVDEASMISNTYSEGEFFRFGNGFLLQDLLAYANLQLGRKIIFIGDPAQLPPVGDAESQALDPVKLKQLIGGTEEERKVVGTELREVVRQKGESGILSHASMIREGIRSGTFNYLNLHNRFPDISHFDLATQLLNQYTQAVKRHGIEGAIIITYSNHEASQCNEIIRNHYFPGEVRACRGDWMLINQNNTLYPIDAEPLQNGEFGKLLSVGQPESREVSIQIAEAGRKRVRLSFCPIEMEVPRGDKKILVECMMLENLLYTLNPKDGLLVEPGADGWMNPNRDISREEHMALFVDAVMRAEANGIKRRTPEFKEFLRTDPYFNCLRLKFGYAITCHKAQGGEWAEAWVSMQTGRGQRNETYFRWAYTAITRAKTHLHLYRAPQFSPYSQLGWSEVSVPQNQGDTGETISLSPVQEESLAKLGLAKAEPFLQQHALRLDRATESCLAEIRSRDSRSYLEIYYFRRGNETARIQWHYNGKQQIKPGVIQTSGTTSLPLAEEILAALDRVPELKIVPGEAKSSKPVSIQPDFSDKPLELAQLFDALRPLVESMGIAISDLQHHNYAEHYTFSRGTEQARVIFDYGQDRTFSGARPIEAHCNSQPLLDDLNDCITKIRSLEPA